MSPIEEQFAGADFKKHIQNYCAEQEWEVADLTDNSAVLVFEMPSGQDRTCYILLFDTTLEFSVPSALEFDTLDDVPHRISTMLLARSRERKMGFWCIEEIEDKQVYECMHNIEMELINSDYFAVIVRLLIEECEAMEGVITKMLG